MVLVFQFVIYLATVTKLILQTTVAAEGAWLIATADKVIGLDSNPSGLCTTLGALNPVR